MDVGRRRGESRRAGRRRVYRGRRPHHWSGLESPGWTIEDTGLPKEAHKQDDEQGCSRSSRTSCAPLHKALHGQKCRGGQDDEHGCSNVGGDRMSKADGPGGDEFIEAAGRTSGPAWRVREGRATRTPGFRRKPINRTTNTDVLAALAPPALRCIRPSMAKSVAEDRMTNMDVLMSAETGCRKPTVREATSLSRPQAAPLVRPGESRRDEPRGHQASEGSP